MAGGALLRFLLPRASMNYIFYLRRAAAKITKSAAPFIFTAATVGTGNFRFALGILEFHKIRYCEALKKEGAISFIRH